MEPPQSVLVVDDELVNRELLGAVVEMLGHEPEYATDGLAAISQIRPDHSLVLLDMMMPGMDGLQVLQWLKENPLFRHIPVVVISAVDAIDTITKSLRMGADDYLAKPFNSTLLKARIDASLEKKRLRDREQQHLRQLQEFNEKLEQRVEEALEEIQEKAGLLERRVQEYTAMFDISTAIISSLDVDDVLDRIMELSQDVMTAEASSLLLLDPEIGKLRFHVARGKAGESLKSATVELGQGIAGLVAQTGEPLLIEDAYADPRFNPAYDVQTGFRTRSILTSPVKTKEGVLGVVQVINKIGQDAFDSHDLHLFQLFAGLASISLENAQLFEQTRAMAEDLRRALEQERQLSIEKEKMGAYIDQQVVDEISRNRERTLALGGKIVTATVLFADLQGFTRIAETMQPQGVVSFLNEYLAAMTSIVKSEGGLLDKFLGDGLMAVFLTNEDYPEPHALRAVRAGLCMQERAKELKREWVVQRPEAAGLQARIGINTGEVVAGNIGSAVRMDYTVIGDNVNVASRIESNARGGEVYVSESTYNSVREYFDAERQEPIHVKNRAQPVQTYAVRVRS